MSNREAIAINSPPSNALPPSPASRWGHRSKTLGTELSCLTKKPDLLWARKTIIELLAPTFGIRAFRELTGENAPLANLAVILTYWNEVSTLRRTASN